MGAKGWIIFIVVAIGALGGLVFLSQQNKKTVTEYDGNIIISANEDNANIADHVYGKADSPVILIEYGDYQCPGCKSIYPTVEELKEKYKDQIAFVFRNFPIASIHPNARAAAASAEAAGIQGKYWEMYSMIYENQDEWSAASTTERASVFEKYATQLELDLDAFKEAVASEQVDDHIAFDQALGKQQNVSSTPTFILNGEMLDSETWGDDEAFETAIRDAITKAGLELPADDTSEE